MDLKEFLQLSKTRNHKFWDTQPVPSMSATVTQDGEIVKVDKVKQVPFPLPDQFEWCTVDLLSQLHQVYQLLADNYVEDDDATFRFAYTLDFLKWALMPPNYNPDWFLGVRVKGGILVAFISAVPADVRIREKTLKVVEINFLCVLKKLRHKRLAPLLIKYSQLI